MTHLFGKRETKDSVDKIDNYFEIHVVGIRMKKY